MEILKYTDKDLVRRNNMLDIRLALGLTKRQLAAYLDIDVYSLGRYELKTKYYRNPSYKIATRLIKLCKILGYPLLIDEIFYYVTKEDFEKELAAEEEKKQRRRAHS